MPRKLRIGRGAIVPKQDPDFADHLIELQINQDRGSQAWTKFLVAVQGGLGTAYGYILLSGKMTGVKYILAMLIAFIAICACVSIGRIIKRVHQWSGWFIGRYRNLDDVYRVGSIFPTEPGQIDKMKPGVISGAIISFCWVIAGLWILAMFLATWIWKSAP